jgi:hypothetical protein
MIGEHTDYNPRPVLPVALEQRTAVAASHAEDWIVASTIGGRCGDDLDAPSERLDQVRIRGGAQLRKLGAAPAARVTVARRFHRRRTVVLGALTVAARR